MFAETRGHFQHSACLWFSFDLPVSPDLLMRWSSSSAAMFTGHRSSTGIPGVQARSRWPWQSEVQRRSEPTRSLLHSPSPIDPICQLIQVVASDDRWEGCSFWRRRTKDPVKIVWRHQTPGTLPFTADSCGFSGVVFTINLPLIVKAHTTHPESMVCSYWCKHKGAKEQQASMGENGGKALGFQYGLDVAEQNVWTASQISGVSSGNELIPGQSQTLQQWCSHGQQLDQISERTELHHHLFGSSCFCFAFIQSSDVLSRNVNSSIKYSKFAAAQ